MFFFVHFSHRWHRRAYSGTQLPVAYDGERGACIYGEARSEPLYNPNQIYECKTFTSPTACEKCLSQSHVNGYGHYWEYIKDGTLTLAPENIPSQDGTTCGVYITNTSRTHMTEDGIKPSEETGETEAQLRALQAPCRYICTGRGNNEANMATNHELFTTLDDTPMKRL